MTDYAFGLLLIHNDDVVEPGEGFDMHQHADTEIVTWIAHGRLRHRDSAGTEMILDPGEAEAITAGRGIRHAETNAAGSTTRDSVRVIQMWLPTDSQGVEPSHSVANLNEALSTGDLVTVASGDGEPGAALTIRTSGARLRAARLPQGRSVTTDEAPFVHIFVVSGSVRISASEDHGLSEGDAVRLTDEGPVIIAGCYGDGNQPPAEVLVWEMRRSVKTTPTWRS
jgi:redox-sensitive bicupin YhaK (pirin superfamily)